jgi:hypothetical protein
LLTKLATQTYFSQQKSISRAFSGFTWLNGVRGSATKHSPTQSESCGVIAYPEASSASQVPNSYQLAYI